MEAVNVRGGDLIRRVPRGIVTKAGQDAAQEAAFHVHEADAPEQCRDRRARGDVTIDIEAEAVARVHIARDLNIAVESARNLELLVRAADADAAPGAARGHLLRLIRPNRGRVVDDPQHGVVSVEGCGCGIVDTRASEAE